MLKEKWKNCNDYKLKLRQCFKYYNLNFIKKIKYKIKSLKQNIQKYIDLFLLFMGMEEKPTIVCHSK